jgi:predicted branched-subunit amino acid permease
MSLIGAGQATLGALAAAILVINARYILFGATLRPWLGAVPPRLAYPSLLLLGDGNWILTMNAAARGEADRAYLAGSGLPMIAGWLGGTALGATAGGVLPAPEALGADFMLPAFAAAMMAGMTKGRGDIGPIAAGAGAALAVAPFGGAGWATVAAGVAGAALAALLSGRRA